MKVLCRSIITLGVWEHVPPVKGIFIRWHLRPFQPVYKKCRSAIKNDMNLMDFTVYIQFLI